MILKLVGINVSDKDDDLNTWLNSFPDNITSPIYFEIKLSKLKVFSSGGYYAAPGIISINNREYPYDDIDIDFQGNLVILFYNNSRILLNNT